MDVAREFLIAKGPADYVARALALATDTELRLGVRSMLTTARLSGKFFKPAAVPRDYLAAFQGLLEIRTVQDAPRHLIF